MTKLVVGIDHGGASITLNVLKQLQFAKAEVHLLHSIEGLLPETAYPNVSPSHPLRARVEQLEEEGRSALAQAQAKLAQSAYEVSVTLRRGDAGRSLIEFAEEQTADIIAVESAKKDAWGSLFYGSVTKALTSGAKQSLLIAKRAPRTTGSLSAIFATDHSDYSKRCADKLLTWTPQGLARITVLRAISEPEHHETSADLSSAEAEETNELLASQFQAAGIDSDQVIIEGHPNDVIAQTMKQCDADLLIVGARGHGFWDRVFLGSVSHYQVVATEHNVMAIRL